MDIQYIHYVAYHMQHVFKVKSNLHGKHMRKVTIAMLLLNHIESLSRILSLQACSKPLKPFWQIGDGQLIAISKPSNKQTT